MHIELHRALSKNKGKCRTSEECARDLMEAAALALRLPVAAP